MTVTIKAVQLSFNGFHFIDDVEFDNPPDNAVLDRWKGKAKTYKVVVILQNGVFTVQPPAYRGHAAKFELHYRQHIERSLGKQP